MVETDASHSFGHQPAEITLLREEVIPVERNINNKDGGGSSSRRRCTSNAFSYFKGYKAVILFSSFFCYFTLCGITLTVGVYFNVWRDDFNAGSALTSWLGSVHIGVLHAVAPVVGILTDRFGFRPMVMLGAIIYTASLIATSFANSIYVVLVTFSIFAGIGGGFVYVPASTIVSLYYEKGRAFSNGFSTCGCGFGQFIMPFILNAAIDTYSWRDAMWISACVALQLFVLGALMREPKIWRSIKADKKQKAKEGRRIEQIGCHIYKNPGFVLLLLQLMLSAAGLSIVYVHIAAITEEVGQVSPKKATVPLSLLGFCTIIGRLSAGLISQVQRVDTFIFYISCFIVAGAVTILTPFIPHFGFICFWAIAFGLMTAPSAALVQIMALYFVEVGDLNAAFSHAAVFTAVGYIVGAPIAGWLADYTKKYTASFYLGGSVLIFSGLLLVWPYINYRLEHKKPVMVQEAPEDTGTKEVRRVSLMPVLIGGAPLEGEPRERKYSRTSDQSVPSHTSPEEVHEMEPIAGSECLLDE